MSADKKGDRTPRKTSNRELKRRTLIKSALASAAAGAVFAPKAAAAASGMSLSSAVETCDTDCLQANATSAQMQTIRQGLDGPNSLHAVAQEVAASMASTQQVEFLAKFYAKVRQIRTGETNLTIGALTYHY